MAVLILLQLILLQPKLQLKAVNNSLIFAGFLNVTDSSVNNGLLLLILTLLLLLLLLTFVMGGGRAGGSFRTTRVFRSEILQK